MSDLTNGLLSHERLFNLTRFPSIRDNVGKRLKPTTWPRLVERLSRGQDAPERKDELPTWCPTVFEGGKRSQQTVRSISLFTLDIDNELLPAQYDKLPEPRPDVIEVVKAGKKEPVLRLKEPNRPQQVLGALPGVACVWHTSFSHGPECPKYRFVFPLSRDVDAGEYKRLWPILDEKLRAGGILPDPATKDGARTWFLPARTENFESGNVDGEYLDVDALLTQAESAGEGPPETPVQKVLHPNKAEAKRSKAKAATPSQGKTKVHPLEEILSAYSLVRSPVGRIYAELGNELVPVDSGKFLGRIARQVLALSHQFVGKDTIKSALLAFSSDDLPQREVPVRVARDCSGLYLDLGGDVVEIAPLTGISILGTSPVAFYRPETARKLPRPKVPSCDQDCHMALERFKVLLGVEGQDWHSILAWLVAAVGVTGTYPVLICKGEKGSGKSTRTRLIRSLIDPRRPAMTGPPKDEEALAIQAQNAHVLAYDNLRFLVAAMSDALCRLATGDGMEKRTLYSDLDLTVLEATRPVILNGISDVAKEPDLLDRALICTFRRVEERKTESEIMAEFESMHAEVLGALCYLCRLALRRGDAEVPKTIRMLGPAGFAAAIEDAMGIPGGSIAAAYEGARDAAVCLAADDELVGALVDWFDGQKTWTGTMAELLNEVEGEVLEFGKRRPRWLPETSRKLSADLDKYAENLRQLGLDFTKAMSGSGADRRNRVTFLWLDHDDVCGDVIGSKTTEQEEDEPEDDEDFEGLLDGV